MGKQIIILGIESSCDETAASVCINGNIVSNSVQSQQIHSAYGGVVPELASRAHDRNIVPVVHKSIQEANIHKNQITAIAFTQGPGLMGSLLVGVNFAKAMALANGIAMVGVDHMKAHIYANCISMEAPIFPFLCLTASGGHTHLHLVHDYFRAELLGQTIDDAVGEAFDKAAKLLGLGYPGGPLLDKMAVQGDSTKYTFSKPRVPGLDFSFSGVKTSFLYFLKSRLEKEPDFVARNLHDLCASYQQTLIDIVVDKVEKAMVDFPTKCIALAGGVSANSLLRKSFLELGKSKGVKVCIPPLEYCTDNAAMIAFYGFHLYQAGVRAPQDAVPYTTMS